LSGASGPRIARLDWLTVPWRDGTTRSSAGVLELPRESATTRVCLVMEITDGVATREAAATAGESDQDIVAGVHVRRGRELWTLGRRLGLSADEADDAVQEALTRLLRELARGKQITDPE